MTYFLPVLKGQNSAEFEAVVEKGAAFYTKF